MEFSVDETGSNGTVTHENLIPEVSFCLKSLLNILLIAFVRLKSFCSDCHSPLPDWIADAGELVLGADMGAPQDSRKGILVINSNSN